ncbi:hypothetical protein CRUP_021974, partial [Coryphaenoides rupestris]
MRQVLYIADDNEIRQPGPQAGPTGATSRPYQGTPTIYWTNWHTGRISFYDLPPSSSSGSSSSGSSSSPNGNRNRDRRQSDSRIPDLKMPRGIAVDWVANNLDVIEVAQISGGRHRKTLIWGMIDEPYAIVIETAAMDGTMRETLVEHIIQWPTGLAVDYFNERLYWADAKLSTIGSVRLNGSDAVVAVSGVKNKLYHPFSIDVFEDYIYGVTYFNNHVFRVNKFGRGVVENLTTGINHATDIVLYHRYKQPEMANPCDRKKCEWLYLFVFYSWCLLSPSGPPNYGGDRCQVDQCRDYCQNGGTCTPSPSGSPTCRCLKGFTGPHCNLHTCKGYCHNGGNCSVTPGNQPTCHCPFQLPGRPVPGHCLNGGKCLQRADGSKQCRCAPQYLGSHCEVDRCHYCRDGKCIPTNVHQPTGEVTC